MIKKAILPVAGLGTRFLPLSKTVPKELWPIADKPMLQHILEEAVASGIKHVIFVISPDKKIILDYFNKPSKELGDILKTRKRDELLNRLKSLEEILKNVTFSFVMEKDPLGDGHAVLQARKLIGDDACAVLFGDDIVESKTPCLAQLINLYKTCQKSVLALHRLPEASLPFYGICGVEKIANRVFKVQKIVEKPSIAEAPSDLTIVGKYILTPEVFDYLKETQPNQRKEIILADALDQMLKDGKMVYGYEFEGEWWECGNLQAYLWSNIHFASKHPEFGPKLKEFLKEIK